MNICWIQRRQMIAIENPQSALRRHSGVEWPLTCHTHTHTNKYKHIKIISSNVLFPMRLKSHFVSCFSSTISFCVMSWHKLYLAQSTLFGCVCVPFIHFPHCIWQGAEQLAVEEQRQWDKANEVRRWPTFSIHRGHVTSSLRGHHFYATITSNECKLLCMNYYERRQGAT